MANPSKNGAPAPIFHRFTMAGIANRSWHNFLLILDRTSGPQTLLQATTANLSELTFTLKSICHP